MQKSVKNQEIREFPSTISQPRLIQRHRIQRRRSSRDAAQSQLAPCSLHSALHGPLTTGFCTQIVQNIAKNSR